MVYNFLLSNYVISLVHPIKCNKRIETWHILLKGKYECELEKRTLVKVPGLMRGLG